MLEKGAARIDGVCTVCAVCTVCTVCTVCAVCTVCTVCNVCAVCMYCVSYVCMLNVLCVLCVDCVYCTSIGMPASPHALFYLTVDKSLSSGASGPHSTSLSPTLDDWDPIKNHFFTQSSDFHRVLQADEEKVFQICRNFNSRHGCRYGNRCRFLHAPMGLSSERRTWETTSHDIHMMPLLPKPKSWVAVEVITVINPCLFYVHFPAGPASLLSTTKPLEG